MTRLIAGGGSPGAGGAVPTMAQIAAAPELKAAYGAAAASLRIPTFMCLGDSLTAFGGAAYDTTAGQSSYNYNEPASGVTPIVNRSYPLWAQLLSSSRVLHIGSAATSGYTTAQIRDTHLPTVLAAKPTYCVVLAGQNDDNTIGTGSWSTQGKQAYWDILQRLLAAGIIPIACTIPATAITMNKNAGIRRMALDLGVRVVDFYAATADQTTGLYVSGYAGPDNIHPIDPGVKAMGQALANLFTQLHPTSQPEQWLGVTNGYYNGNNTYGLALSRPLLLTDNGATTPGPVPQGWASVASATALTLTAAAATDPWLGRKWTLTRGATDTSYRSGDMTVAPGDRMFFAVRMGATVEASAGGWQMQLLNTTDSAILFDTGPMTRDVPMGAVWAHQWKVPSGLAGTQVRWIVKATVASGAAISIAQPSFYNLTAMKADTLTG